MPRSFTYRFALVVPDMLVPGKRPAMLPYVQNFLEDVLEDIPEPELRALWTVLDRVWEQSPRGSACKVAAVSDYPHAFRPGMGARSQEYDELA